MPILSTSDVVQSELATFFRVFPEGTVWANTVDGQGYDILLAATGDGGGIDVDTFTDRFNDPASGLVALSLAEVGIGSANALLATYTGGRETSPRGWRRARSIGIATCA